MNKDIMNKNVIPHLHLSNLVYIHDRSNQCQNDSNITPQMPNPRPMIVLPPRNENPGKNRIQPASEGMIEKHAQPLLAQVIRMYGQDSLFVCFVCFVCVRLCRHVEYKH